MSMPVTHPSKFPHQPTFKLTFPYLGRRHFSQKKSHYRDKKSSIFSQLLNSKCKGQRSDVSGHDGRPTAEWCHHHRVKKQKKRKPSLKKKVCKIDKRTQRWGRMESLLILKTIGNRKGDCAWSCSRWQTQPEKICKSQRTNQCHSLRTLYWFVRCDLQIFSGCVCHLEQLHAQSPFLFPIVFSINLIPFFDISSVLAVHSPGLFGYVLLYFTWATARSQELLFVVLACHALRALDSRCRLRTRRRVCIWHRVNALSR